VALEAAVQRRARKIRDYRLYRAEIDIQWEQGVLSEGDDDRLFLDRLRR